MCGIAGYVRTSQPDPRFDMAFALMGVFMEERGSDSWGWTNGTEIRKRIGRISSAFGPEYRGEEMAALHTRHATTGAINSDNSHPFQMGDLIGMHNGMIYNHAEVTTKYERKLPVDSQHIFQHILESRPLSELEGYGTIVFWRGGKTYLGRFNNGELHIALTEFGIVYASTRWAIDDAFAVAGISDKIKHFYTVKEGVLHTIEPDGLYITDVVLDVRKAVVSKPKWNEVKAPDAATIVAAHMENSVRDVQSSATSLGGCEVCHKALGTWPTPAGDLCDKCADAYYAYDDSGIDYLDIPDDIVQVSTARELDPGLNFVGCSYCTAIMHGDDKVYVQDLEEQDFACEDCNTYLIEESSSQDVEPELLNQN